MKANCPVCGKELEADPTRPGFPFCSPRCKLIDLGRWIDGRNNVPALEPDDEGDADPEE